MVLSCLDKPRNLSALKVFLSKLDMQKPLILAIETSCDDTSAALVDSTFEVLANVTSSQDEVHKKYGGIVPELASREHIRSIIPVVEMALEKADVSKEAVDVIAVSANPGLIGSLLVGVSFAKGFAYSIEKPLIAINHLLGHVCANFIEHKEIEFPFLSLVVSGGHTELVHFRTFDDFTVLGKTVDDAAVEAFDKIAKLLGKSYPGGPFIDVMAHDGNPKEIEFPLPMAKHDTCDFSFSGLKTAGMLYLKGHEGLTTSELHDFTASFQHAIIQSLLVKTTKAIEELQLSTLLISGGVAANSALRMTFSNYCKNNGVRLFYPSVKYCTDNAAMIGAAAQFKYRSKNFAPLDLNASPQKGLKL